MPQTLENSYSGQIIGGIFNNRDDADKAIDALEALNIASENIELIRRMDGTSSEAFYKRLISDRGFSAAQARYHDEMLRDGKILVVVYGVTAPAPIIDIFDKFKAEFNPNGSRNLREDVLGMTAGAFVGATILGAVGAVVGGPVGSAVGGIAGAFLGGGTGAAAGKDVEHDK